MKAASSLSDKLLTYYTNKRSVKVKRSYIISNKSSNQKITIMRLSSILFMAAIILGGCRGELPPPKEVEGYAPVYGERMTIQDIKYGAPVPIENGGKIYIKGTFLLQVETGKGIHVINIANPEEPKRIGFITVGGAQEISIYENMLYVNSYNDLIVISIDNLDNLKVENVIEGAFKLFSQQLPPEPGYFECVDTEKGIVTGWTKKMLKFPKCKTGGF